MSADRQLDGVGYDLEFSDARVTLHVEVKGIVAPDLAFNLTRLEHERAGTDPLWRLCAVTSALGDARVEVLSGPEVLNLEMRVVQYRASRL